MSFIFMTRALWAHVLMCIIMSLSLSLFRMISCTACPLSAGWCARFCPSASSCWGKSSPAGPSSPTVRFPGNPPGYRGDGQPDLLFTVRRQRVWSDLTLAPPILTSNCLEERISVTRTTQRRDTGTYGRGEMWQIPFQSEFPNTLATALSCHSNHL